MLQKKHQIITGIIVICLLLTAAAFALSNWFGSSNFGKAVISMKDGSKVYVIHEQWGLHEDEISITQNTDGCKPPDPNTDYIDTQGDGESLVYSLTNNELVIYEEPNGDAAHTLPWHQPSKPWLGVNVAVKQTRRNPREYGVTVLKVPLNETCWKNFFRKVGTSLRNGR